MEDIILMYWPQPSLPLSSAVVAAAAPDLSRYAEIVPLGAAPFS